MDTGLNNRFLYAAVKLTCRFSNGLASDTKIVSGTGFFAQDRQSQPVLLTNRHIIDIAYGKSKYRGMSLALTAVNITLRTLSASGLTTNASTYAARSCDIFYAASLQDDVACLRLGGLVSHSPSAPGTAVTPICIDYALVAQEHEFRNDGFSVGDFVAFPGFPEWHDIENHRPIMRGGTIASDPEFPYRHQDVQGDCIAYEAFSFDGSSGSPVFTLQRSIPAGSGLSNPRFRAVRLIGINAGHLKPRSSNASHSGISYMFRSTSFIPLLDKATPDISASLAPDLL